MSKTLAILMILLLVLSATAQADVVREPLPVEEELILAQQFEYKEPKKSSWWKWAALAAAIAGGAAVAGGGGGDGGGGNNTGSISISW